LFSQNALSNFSFFFFGNLQQCPRLAPYHKTNLNSVLYNFILVHYWEYGVVAAYLLPAIF
jgi:hypothetical protein